MIRMFQYDTQIALEGSTIENGVLKVTLPKSAVVYLRQNKASPDILEMIIEDEEQRFVRKIPVIKIQKYSLNELFEKRLLFFLPFYIFVHEKELSVYSVDEVKRRILVEEYEYIIHWLDKLEQSDEIDELEKQCIITSMREVLRLIAKRYKKIVTEGERVMGGELLEYPAKTSYREGRAEGLREGRNAGILKKSIQVFKNCIARGMSKEDALAISGLDEKNIPVEN